LSFLFIGLLLILPSVNISTAQESYVGVNDGKEYLWRLSINKVNWGSYIMNNMAYTMENLWPLGPSALVNVYYEWLPWQHGPPQAHWPFSVTSIGLELTSTILSPYDNTSIRSTPVYAQFGWELPHAPDYNSLFNGTWYVVNDTASFLRQTYNLTLAFSPYAIMGVPFVPININWTMFITEFLAIMNFRGEFYNTTTATANSNGYSISVPAWGYENNTVAFDINVKYNSRGVLTYYEFIYGGDILTKYWIYTPDVFDIEDMVTLIVSSVIIIGIALLVYGMRWVIKHNN
jgi:hypothetical protein